MGSPKYDAAVQSAERTLGDNYTPPDGYNPDGTPKSSPFKPGKAYSDDLSSRWDAYQQAIQSGDLNALGIPWEQQKQLIAQAAQQAAAGQQAAVTELNRGALAGQGFQSGAFAKAAENVADQGQAAAASTAAKVAGLNQQLIDQRVGQLRAEMMGLRDHREDLVNQYLQMSLDAGTELYKIADGGA